MRATIFLMLAMVAAGPAAAQITFETPATAPPTAATAKSTNPNDKIICEKQEEIGSRLGGKKVCKTASQW